MSQPLARMRCTKPYIAVCVGTRPELIKVWSLFAPARDAGLNLRLIHTGQHYDLEMDRDIRDELAMPLPAVHIGIGSADHATQTANVLTGLESVLGDDPPLAVLVQGDTNSAMAGALWASKRAIPVGHIEAGLRSGDRTMPEELNRILIDHLADWLYAPTTTSAANLAREGIPAHRVVVTGNTVVDALLHMTDRLDGSDSLDDFDVTPGQFALVTLHRPANVDDPVARREVLEAIDSVRREHSLAIAFPIHPRTERQLGTGDRRLLHTWHVRPPQGYRQTLQLIRAAAIVLTDSGGIQEEACVLQTPCIVLRSTTERPEAVEVGAARVTNRNPGLIHSALGDLLGRAPWPNPFGDGTAGDSIIQHLRTATRALGRTGTADMDALN